MTAASTTAPSRQKDDKTTTMRHIAVDLRILTAANTYLTETYNRIAHSASPIRVDIDSPAFNGAGLSIPLCGDLRVDVLP